MKYMTIIDGAEYEGYNSFDEKNLKMAVHKGQFSKEMNFKPVQQPMIIFPDGSSACLNNAHIRASSSGISILLTMNQVDQLSGG